MASSSSTFRRLFGPFVRQDGGSVASVTRMTPLAEATFPSPVIGLGRAIESPATRTRNSSFSLIHYLIAGTVTVVILALAFGLGFGLTRHHTTTVTIYGAINGSGIVAIDLENKSTITAYTQNEDGIITVSQYTNGTWTGGALSDLVTANGSFNGEDLTARKGTPLMSESYARDGELIVG
jgi:hypothetical protein